MITADKESKEINTKVFRPANKLAALEKKKEEKDRIEMELIEVRRKKEEAKEEADEINEVKRRREEEKVLNKSSKKIITSLTS